MYSPLGSTEAGWRMVWRRLHASPLLETTQATGTASRGCKASTWASAKPLQPLLRPDVEWSESDYMPDLLSRDPHNQQAGDAGRERTWSSAKPLQPPLRPAEVPPVRGSQIVGHLLFSASVCEQVLSLSSNAASFGRHGTTAQDKRRCVRTVEVRKPLLVPAAHYRCFWCVLQHWHLTCVLVGSCSRMVSTYGLCRTSAAQHDIPSLARYIMAVQPYGLVDTQASGSAWETAACRTH